MELPENYEEMSVGALSAMNNHPTNGGRNMRTITPRLRTTYQPDDGQSLNTVFGKVFGVVLLGLIAALVLGWGCAKAWDEPTAGELLGAAEWEGYYEG